MTPRHALIAKIHVAKKQLQLTDDEYCQLLYRVAGETSCKDMNLRQLERVWEEFKRRGYVEPAQHRRREKAAPHVRMIYALWNDLRDMGALSDGSKSALRSFVKRQTQALTPGGYQAPEFIPADEAAPVIEALKNWIARENAARENELRGKEGRS